MTLMVSRSRAVGSARRFRTRATSTTLLFPTPTLAVPTSPGSVLGRYVNPLASQDW